MRRFSAQYVITNTGNTLKRAIINTLDDGTILSVEDTGGELKEGESIEFYNGIIIPGFVNCHCHLELSHMKGVIGRGTGLAGFIELVRNERNSSAETVYNSAVSADSEILSEGTVLCADVCNNTVTFNIKKESLVKYHSFLEVFGIDPGRACKRLEEIENLASVAAETGIPFSLVPHSVYSMSLTLMRLLRSRSEENRLTSIHFMESFDEIEFLNNHSGPLVDSYIRSGIMPGKLETVKNHSDAVLNEISPNGNLILVHNTFADRETIRIANSRKNIFWCLCPNSNLYIEGKVPPLELLLDEECEIVIGTDSLSSNNRLSILEELKTLQQHFPGISMELLIKWATFNGAKALEAEGIYGTIEAGKKPGLVLLQDLDLALMKLLPGSYAERLI